TGMRADDAATDAAMRRLVEQELREAFVAAVRDRAPRCGPREHRFPVLDALRFALLFGQPGPSDFRIGVRYRWDLPCIEVRVLSCGGLCGDVRLVHGLMRKHRLADDVADRV